MPDARISSQKFSRIKIPWVPHDGHTEFFIQKSRTERTDGRTRPLKQMHGQKRTKKTEFQGHLYRTGQGGLENPPHISQTRDRSLYVEVFSEKGRNIMSLKEEDCQYMAARAHYVFVKRLASKDNGWPHKRQYLRRGRDATYTYG